MTNLGGLVLLFTLWECLLRPPIARWLEPRWDTWRTGNCIAEIKNTTPGTKWGSDHVVTVYVGGRKHTEAVWGDLTVATERAKAMIREAGGPAT